MWRIFEYNRTPGSNWRRFRRSRSHRNTNTDLGMRGDCDTIVPGAVAHPWRQVSPSARRTTSNPTFSVERCFLNIPSFLPPAGWCGKSTKTTTPTVAMTTTDYVARTAVTQSRVRASCRAPKRYFSFVFFSSTTRLLSWYYKRNLSIANDDISIDNYNGNKSIRYFYLATVIYMYFFFRHFFPRLILSHSCRVWWWQMWQL